MPAFRENLIQAPRHVVMVRPHRFRSNPQTMADNAFQSRSSAPEAQVASDAVAEFYTVVAALRSRGVVVHEFQDTGVHDTPDSVFPNNWFSTHSGGHIAIYPMFSPNRRLERRADIIEFLRQSFRVQDIIDYSGLELDGLVLEGTGAMVLDHIANIAYVARSNRADPIALERFCTHFGYEPMVFDAADSAGRAVYHTNVMMCIGTEIALLGAAQIANNNRRDEVIGRLRETGRSVVRLSAEEISRFAGNAIELSGHDHRFLALSQSAYDGLTQKNREAIAAILPLVPLPVPTLETAGGSVRCMIAGIHLTPRPVRATPKTESPK
ncbi:MAG: arginine deiminase-related protein [Paracoccaceae bacterium]